MNTGGLILIVVALIAATAAFIWLALKLNNLSAGGVKQGKALSPEVTHAADEDVEHIFNDEFREELRNRGRLHFEKVIGESAIYLQQDLHQTTSQVNDYMRNEITNTLQAEFKKYEQSISDAKQLAIGSLEKTITTIDQQRLVLEQQLQSQSQAQKEQTIKRFETDMATIINHYISHAIGGQIDLSDQLDFILADLEANKAAILEDIQRGA